VRAQPGLKRLPIIVLTSSGQDPDVNRAYDLGANSYLVKPVKFDGLVEMIKALNIYWLILAERPGYDS
jgi:DNA-binding response OmpR family regulator